MKWDYFREVVLGPVPSEFLGYLSSDGLFAGGLIEKSLLSESSEEIAEGDDESILQDTPSFCFPSFHAQIEQAIIELGGSCMPKLAGCSPKDAVWISTEHSMRCCTASEVYVLLKASDRVAWATNSASKDKIYLILRKWCENFEHYREFRLFLRNGFLIAACQRDDTVFYEFLRAEHDKIQYLISSFIDAWKERPEEGVIDVLLDGQDSVKILDVARWDTKNVSPILFEWEDLMLLEDSEKWELRLVNSESHCRLGTARLNCFHVSENDFFQLSQG